MKIEDVEAIPYQIPFRKPLKFASGQITHAEHVYETKANAGKGIESVTTNAPGAKVVDLTEHETAHSPQSLVRSIGPPLCSWWRHLTGQRDTIVTWNDSGLAA
jgi:L-Ala-D/L-Glu epimerase